jgi:hypothetical protein
MIIQTTRSDMVAGLLSDTLTEKVPERIIKQIKRALVPSTGTSVSYVTSVVVRELCLLFFFIFSSKKMLQLY